MISNIKNFIIPLVFLALPVLGSAQEDTCACCKAVNDQFDFWVGDWTVKNRAGETIGRNTIRELEDNCLISEEWQGIKNSSGRSYNYYDPEKQSWNQLWVSNTGNILKLEGGLVNGKMILTGPMQTNEQGSYRNQIVWTPQEDGTVTQEWIILSEGDVKADTLFFGIYYPKEDLHRD